MPRSTRASSTTRSLTLLLYAVAAAAILLWLAGLLASHTHLFPSGPTYADITVYKGRFTLYHSAKFFTSRAYSAFAYPAGAAVLYAALYATSDPLFTYLAAAALITAIAANYAIARLARAGQAVLIPASLAIASFPIVFLIQRANIELFLWIALACGILLARRGWPIPAAMLFGIGAAIKLYPIFLLGLFLRRRRDLPAFALGLFTAALAMAAAISFAGPTFSIAAQGFFHGVDRFQTHYVDTVSQTEIAFDHCLFSPFKYHAWLHHLSPAPWRATYYIAAGIAALLLFLRVRTLPFLNGAVFLTAAMVALPPVSFSYTLTHLGLPLLLLILACATRRQPPTAHLAILILCTALLPLPALRTFGIVPTGPLTSFLLAALLLIAALQPWPANDTADAR